MSTINDPKFKFNFVSGSNPSSRRDSLVKGGVLTIANTHFFKSARAVRCVTPAGHEFEYDLHHLEYVFLEVLDWPEAALQRDLFWMLVPLKASRFLFSAFSAGLLKWEAFDSDNALISHLRECKEGLPEAERGFTAADMVSSPPSSPATVMMDRVKAFILRTADGRMTAAVDLKCMLPAFNQAAREAADGVYQAALETLIDAAKEGLAGKSIAVQANYVISFVLASQPETPDLRTYTPWDKQEMEILRRAKKTESERFIPLLVAAWDDGRDGGFPELKTAFPKTCSGFPIIGFVSLLAARARLPQELVSTTCRAICDIIRGDILAEIDTAKLRTASDTDRCTALGDLVAASARAGLSGTVTQTSKADAEKFRAKPEFKKTATSLEALVSDTPDYIEVIKILAPLPFGRLFIAGSSAAIPVMNKFAGGRTPAKVDAALSTLLGVDEDGKPLGRMCVKSGVGMLLIKGKIAHPDLCIWHDIAVPVLKERDGRSSVDSMSTDAKTFWSDPERLRLSEYIAGKAMAFIGRTGRASGSYISFHHAMMCRATKVVKLPDAHQKKVGLAKMLNKIGVLAMEYAKGEDATMMNEPVMIASIKDPFFPQVKGHPPFDLMTQFDVDLAEAQSQVRLHDDFGEDSAGNFSNKRKLSQTDWRESHAGGKRSWQEWQEPAKKIQARSKLDSFPVFLTSNGLLFGNKFLVQVGGDISTVPYGTCLGCLSYSKLEERRAEWCSKNGSCLSHARPSQLPESQFSTINIHATDLSAEQQKIADNVIATKRDWKHWGGVNDTEIVMGGKGGKNALSSTSVSFASHDLAKGGKGNNRHAGGKGKGGKGKGGKGGKGKGGKGASSSTNFGRQH